MNRKGKIALLCSFVIAGVLLTTLALAPPSACRDGVDNDGDTFTDYPADPGCSSKNDASERNTAIACDDGVDNADADSLIDYPSDSGCTGPADTSETSGQCDDLVDNDGDGSIDYPADSGCTGFADNLEANCGDGTVQAGESCDGSALNNQTCVSQGFLGGTLSCTAACTFNTGSCYNQLCGNNIIEGTEVCDGSALNGQTCTTQGFGGGSLSCNGACTGFATSGCWTNSCGETDTGWGPTVFGVAFGSTNGTGFNLTDTCTSGTQLLEYWCSGASPQSTVVDCTALNLTGCTSGACA